MSRTTEQADYRPLEQSYKADKFTFQLVARQGDVALFAKSQSHHNAPSFDVIMVQKHEAHTWPDGTASPARESMPKSEEWGKKAWTPGNWRQAVDIFQSRLWVQGRFTEPVTWLWPPNPYIPPDKEWVLGRESWEKQHGPPAGWVTAQEVTD